MANFGEPYLSAEKFQLPQNTVSQLVDKCGWVQGHGNCLGVPSTSKDDLLRVPNSAVTTEEPKVGSLLL